jgi:predicted NBD/HSP70 family sugar kinase
LRPLSNPANLTQFRSLATYKHRLARSSATLINILDPDVIVLGGGISNIDTLYIGLPELIVPHAFTDGIRTRVVRAAHGELQRRLRSGVAVADQEDLESADPHEEIVHLEEHIEELAAKIESCRKFMLASRIAVAGGGLVLAAMPLGVIRSDLGFMAAAVSLLLGGIVVWGSNSSTAKEATKELAAAESERVALIERINPRVIS